MKYVVIGANRETGEDVEVTLDAASEKDAATKAAGKGILISKLQPAMDSATSVAKSRRAAVPLVTTPLSDQTPSSLWSDILLIAGFVLGIAFFILWVLVSCYILEGGDPAAQIIWVVVTASSVWVAFDSSRKKIPFNAKQPYLPITNGSPRWLLACLIIWVIMFPYYLVRRSRSAETKAQPEVEAAAPAVDVETELCRFKKLLDDGLISQDEWLKKKQQLLGLS